MSLEQKREIFRRQAPNGLKGMFLLIAVLSVSFIFYNYAAIITSWILSIITKSDVNVKRLGFFELRDVSIRLATSLSIHIDFVSLQRDKPHPTRFFVLRIGDVRIEGEPRRLAKTQMNQTSNENTDLMKEKLRRLAMFSQYCGLIVNRVYLVILEVIPESMLHVTIDDLSIEMFRSRDGWQLETSCRLIQAKVLRRFTTAAATAATATSTFSTSGSGTMLAEISLPLHLSLDVGKERINKIVVQIANPSISITNDMFDILELIKLQQISIENEEKQIETINSRDSLVSIDWQLLLNVDIDSVSIKYTAKFMGEHRYTTLNIKSINIGRCDQNFKLEINNLKLSDQLQKSTLRTNSIVLNVSNELYPEFRATSDLVNISISFEDVFWWKKHFDELNLERFSSRNGKKKPEILNVHKQTQHIDYFLEVASVSCQIIDFEKKASKMSVGFFSFQKVRDNFEIGIETLNFGEQTNDENVTFDVHRWGESIFVGAALIQWNRAETNDVRATIGIDDVKIEWSDRLAKQIRDVIQIMSRRTAENENHKKRITIRMTANRLALISIVHESSFIGFCCTKFDILTTDIKAENIICLQMIRAAIGVKTKDYLLLNEIFTSQRTRLITPKDRNPSPTRRWNQTDRERIDEKARKSADENINPKMFLSADEMKIRIDRRSAITDSISINISSCFYISWSSHLHLILWHSYKSAKQAFMMMKENEEEEEEEAPYKRRKMHIFVKAQNCVEVELELARDHRILWRGDTFYFERVEEQMTVRTNELRILLNAQEIVTVDNPCISVHPSDEKMINSRIAFSNLMSSTNKTWTWAANRFLFRLPFDFNFAQVFDEFINMIKWIKIVHEMKKTEFTSDSPLPCDVRIEFTEVVLELEDDEFENKLKLSSELKEDEVYECEKRSQKLEERILALKKTIPLISKEMIDQLESCLSRKNSEIYIARWKLSKFEPKSLFVSTWKGWSMRAFADISLHGTLKCLELMRNFDPLSPLPPDQIYSTLWARAVEFDVDEWIVMFKDYPMKYLDIKDLHYFGTLVGAESFNEDGRSLRECSIEVPEPWPTINVQRNMSPLKFYYDMQCASNDFTCTYGPCWEPCLSMISLMWNNISSPSRDPSPPLPFWDKMRFLLHGRLLWSSEKFVTTMLASNDPYNETETVEMCWDDFGLDWALGEIRIKSGLRTFLRTASRYDDSQVLTLPDVRLKILLGWECSGDPHDHHSIVLCSPKRLPQYSSLDEHDSYRQFRSSCVNVTLNFDVSAGSCTSMDKMPNVLLYSNSFRCIEQFLKSLTMKNRNVRRGTVFGNRIVLKPQLSKHFGKLQVSVSLPKVLVTYWMSHASPYGFRIFSDGLQLTASFRQTVQHSSVNREMNVQRRKVYTWSTHHMTCTWWATQVHVYGENSQPKNDGQPSEDTFLLGFGRVQYAREAFPGKEIPLHKVTAYDLKMSWTAGNRNACLTIADGVHRAHLLRRILSNDAVKTLNVHLEEEDVELSKKDGANREEQTKKTHRRGYSMTDANPWMLNQLIDEAGTKLVAHCEQATDVPIDSLVGVQLSTMDDVKLLNWQIDLFNSQLVLKGCQRDGYLLVCAAKAQLLQNIHRSVWKDGLLLSKKSWSALLSGMQYFAPISANGLNKEMFQWLNRDVIEEKSNQDTTGFADDFVQKYSATGEAVGGVVQHEKMTTTCENNEEKVQLQRIVSRCSCQIYFCYFSDELKTDSSEDISVPPQIDEKDKKMVGSDDVGIDVLTLKHNMLEATSNSDQYEMVVDIVNNLVLFVDPNKKEVGEKRRRQRFECQIMDMIELRSKIMKYQSDLREIVLMGRYLERQLFYLNQGDNEKLRKESGINMTKEQLMFEAEETKLKMMKVSEKLATYISSYKQRQINRLKDIDKNWQKDVEVIRRFEVCFEDCIWKLTESDGQIALAQTQIRNFLYTRTVRDGNCGDHLFEVGSVRITNLLPDTIYKHALHRDETRFSRQPAIRLFVRDMPPVGGICVKEHFELNIAPMIAEITHRLFDKMMRFFFPGRNIHTNENLEQAEQETSTFSFTRKIASSLSMKHNRAATEKLISKQSAFEKDDIDRMQERADQVNHFMYIKIPEVSFVVSYKGNKDKNLIDVHQFNFVFPLCEFHEQNWTWLDLALAVKQRCKRVLLQQFMRQKLLRNRISNFSIESPIQCVSEEEKKRIAVGVTSSDQKHKK